MCRIKKKLPICFGPNIVLNKKIISIVSDFKYIVLISGHMVFLFFYLVFFVRFDIVNNFSGLTTPILAQICSFTQSQFF